ncbi:MAG: TetR family transcriptional regulator C-terminal domain-containing protein [Clostridiales bacterium]|jgi:AcrR family transcriptional regulator|nr:TetR family transcriptional regulator C-terminal domain-containing protein [Clostridiales bacterium]
MENNKTENRIHRKRQYSQMVIRKAFLELLGKKPINKITVKEICDLADVNRTTFYGNFYDIYDILDRVQNELYEKIEASVKKSKYRNESLFEIFEIIEENRDLCRILFGNNDGRDFVHTAMRIPYAYLLDEWTAKSKLPDERFVYLLEFCANGCVGFVRKWVMEEAKTPYREAAKLLQTFVSASLSVLSENNNKNPS